MQANTLLQHVSAGVFVAPHQALVQRASQRREGIHHL